MKIKTEEPEELVIIAKANAAIAAAEAAYLEAAYTRAAEAEKLSKETEEILEFVESYRKKVRNMLDLNADGQEEESDYKPHERA